MLTKLGNASVLTARELDKCRKFYIRPAFNNNLLVVFDTYILMYSLS